MIDFLFPVLVFTANKSGDHAQSEELFFRYHKSSKSAYTYTYKHSTLHDIMLSSDRIYCSLTICLYTCVRASAKSKKKI
jgi:hypothetical protein